MTTFTIITDTPIISTGFVIDQTVAPKPDLAWARQHLGKFGAFKDAIDAKKADEARYRDHPGYVPKLVVKE